MIVQAPHRPDFQVGLCACCEQPTHCFAGWCACFWPCIISQAGARSGKQYVLGATTHGESFTRWCVLVVCIYCFNAVLGAVRGSNQNSVVTASIGVVAFGFNLYMIYTMFSLRRNARKHYGMQTRDCEDICISCCCSCCSVIQVAREVGVEEPCQMHCEIDENLPQESY